MSQLALAHAAGTTSRHMSFIETGRSRPSREMVLRLAETLDLPLRERNALLVAAGLPAAFPERALSEAAMAPFRSVIRQLLDNHDPYPAWVLDRLWRVVDANAAGHAMTASLGSPTDAPVSLLEAFFAPGPMRDAIENWEEVAWAGLARLRREATDRGPDPELEAVIHQISERLRGVPMPIDVDPDTLVFCPRLRLGGRRISTITTVVAFGATRDVTLNELRVELMFPADNDSAAFFRELAGAVS